MGAGVVSGGTTNCVGFSPITLTFLGLVHSLFTDRFPGDRGCVMCDEIMLICVFYPLLVYVFLFRISMMMDPLHHHL
jgi:hypothetical protein